MLLQFISWTKILRVKFFFSKKETMPTHATAISPHEPTYGHVNIQVPYYYITYIKYTDQIYCLTS
jgi:hypothetical protein